MTQHLIALVPLFAVQDDVDFARRLARRGFDDLAEIVYGRVAADPRSSQDRRFDADLSSIEAKLQELRRVHEPRSRLALAAGLEALLVKWVGERAAHPRAHEGTALLAELHQFVGRTHLALKDPAAADAAYLRSVAVCEQRVSAESDRDRQMFARYALIEAHHARIEALSSVPAMLPTLAGVFKALDELVEAYRWDFDGYVLPLVAATTAGRAARSLAEAAAPEDARRYWSKCFGLIGAARRLLTIPEHREPGLWGAHFEVDAKVRYARFLRANGGSWREALTDAVKVGRHALGLAGALRNGPAGANLILSQAQAHLALGEIASACPLVEEVIANATLRDRLREVVQEHLSELPAILLRKHADSLFGEGRMTESLPVYLRLSEASPGSADLWSRIGACYFWENRPFEAIHALSKALDLKPNRADAEMKRTAIRRLIKLSPDTGLAAHERTHLSFMGDRGWLPYAEEFNMAVDLERAGRHAEALAAWEQLSETDDPHRKVVALFRIAYNSAQLPDGSLSAPELLKRFEAHLGMARTLKTRTTDEEKQILQSANRAANVALRKARDADAALRVSEGTLPLADRDPETAMRTTALRVEAHLAKREFPAAQADHADLKSLYEKHRTGASVYEGSQVTLYRAFSDEAERIKVSDPERSEQMMNTAVNYLPQGEYARTSALAPMLFESARSPASFARARAMLESLLSVHLARVRKDSDPDLEFKLNYMLARAYLGEGDAAKADAAALNLLRDHRGDPDLRDLAGEAKFRRARQLIGVDQAQAYRDAATFSGEASVMYRRLGDSEAYHRNLLRYFQALFEVPEGFETLRRILKQRHATGESPDWDGGAWRERFNFLEKAVEERSAEE